MQRTRYISYHYLSRMNEKERYKTRALERLKKYKTIPMAIQYFRGSYGHVQMGPMMASIMIDIIPIIIVYLVCQKYIIEGVVAGAVKG